MSPDPRTFRVSPNFVLSDFLGNHSVYTKGYPNPFDHGADKLENLKALCYEGLEPLLEAFGPISIAYSYISPEVSAKVVKYQDPAKPSHHRFDLGAAADLCFHKWVEGSSNHFEDLYIPDSAAGSPIAAAHGIDYLDIPYSRLITYSESPYICLAVSAREIVADQPRKAFYENRYQGIPKAKPEYLQYCTESARTRAFRMLQEQGLERDWRGAGYPTYHGGGFKQLQHTRVSKYTMLSDWLFDLKSISNGAKNVPAMNLDSVQDSFAAAGIVYDWLLDTLKLDRLPIVKGYVSHMNRYFDKNNDWRLPLISFQVSTPDSEDARHIVNAFRPPNGAYLQVDGDFLGVNIDVNMVLEEPKESWNVQ